MLLLTRASAGRPDAVVLKRDVGGVAERDQPGEASVTLM
jgi:hypothetical protein